MSQDHRHGRLEYSRIGIGAVSPRKMEFTLVVFPQTANVSVDGTVGVDPDALPVELEDLDPLQREVEALQELQLRLARDIESLMARLRRRHHQLTPPLIGMEQDPIVEAKAEACTATVVEPLEVPDSERQRILEETFRSLSSTLASPIEAQTPYLESGLRHTPQLPTPEGNRHPSFTTKHTLTQLPTPQDDPQSQSDQSFDSELETDLAAAVSAHYRRSLGTRADDHTRRALDGLIHATLALLTTPFGKEPSLTPTKLSQGSRRLRQHSAEMALALATLIEAYTEDTP